ncbi:MAG TPA: hydrogenase expression/formation protein HypE [bacterium]|nr:hydrogenase expression/formation protein HypE [bacterium]
MDTILLSHGSGGRRTHELIKKIFVRHFANPVIKQLNDAALLAMPAGRIAFTTDAFVIQPLFFPGGDIGKLAVCGTVNDLAVSGAIPRYLAAAFIIEEGLPVETLEKIVRSMAAAGRAAGIPVVAGDTKVVEKGACDKLFITTTGIGVVPQGLRLGIDRIRAGDAVIVTGTIGDHGIAALSARKQLSFSTRLRSDCAPLNRLLQKALAAEPGIRFMRDPTRGGVAMVLNEIVEDRSFGIVIEEDALPVSVGVREASQILGFDPLHIANEGKAVLIVKRREAQTVLRALKQELLGTDAAVVGEVTSRPEGKVIMRTSAGGERIVDMPVGEQLPRIC